MPPRNGSSRITCVVDEFGPTDFLSLYGGNNKSQDTPEAKLIGGAPGIKQDAARSASPVTINQSERLFAALKHAGMDAACIRVIGAGRDGFNPEAAARIRQFFDKHLHRQTISISANLITLGSAAAQ